VNFVAVYISEAHADDEWPIRTEKKLKIKQHQEIEDRVNASNVLIKDYDWKIPLYLDCMDNEFEQTYNGWPLRIVLINNDGLIIDYVASPIKPYEGYLQKQLFEQMETTLNYKLTAAQNKKKQVDENNEQQKVEDEEQELNDTETIKMIVENAKVDDQ